MNNTIHDLFYNHNGVELNIEVVLIQINIIKANEPLIRRVIGCIIVSTLKNKGKKNTLLICDLFCNLKYYKEIIYNLH